jgi:hypothetical protein
MESWKKSWWYLMMHIQSLKSMCLSASGLKWTLLVQIAL